MTLDYVKVSLRNIFAPGQAYVALSRARSLDGLQVSDVDFNCVKVGRYLPAMGNHVKWHIAAIISNFARWRYEINPPPKIFFNVKSGFTSEEAGKFPLDTHP